MSTPFFGAIATSSGRLYRDFKSNPRDACCSESRSRPCYSFWVRARLGRGILNPLDRSRPIRAGGGTIRRRMEIVQPIALDFDARDDSSLWRVTTLPPRQLLRSKHDRIRVLEDTNGDGRPIDSPLRGNDHAMDLAVHFDGSVLVATRNEILRLRRLQRRRQGG